MLEIRGMAKSSHNAALVPKEKDPVWCQLEDFLLSPLGILPLRD